MNIPKTLKVGGKTYAVAKTDKLELGCNYNGEILYQNLKIHVRPGLAPQAQEVTFIHEMIHAIYNHLGYHDHDEKKVDELANALHMIIVDNPGLFQQKIEEDIKNDTN